MRLRIGSRQSDLAKIQAYQVGEALLKVNPELKIEYLFSASLGDKNLDDPLWKMPERGVFTNDYYEGLLSGLYDIVVHSWKDLPIESREGTSIVATLPRADARDLLLVRKNRMRDIKENQVFNVYTSSPRREYNLSQLLRELLPIEIKKVNFKSVRGNVQTRISKLLNNDVDGLVVAKAALDRLLGAVGEEFSETKMFLRKSLTELNWMVLPLKENPCAPAQGALAIEVKNHRHDIVNILEAVNCKETFQNCQVERSVLAQYGGGCHQKIGVSSLSRNYGKLLFLSGLSDSGEILKKVELKRNEMVKGSERAKTLVNSKKNKTLIYPNSKSDLSWFDRMALELPNLPEGSLVWVARVQALESKPKLPKNSVLWASGLKTWRQLAKEGYWVTGCAEGLGEQEMPNVDLLVGQKLQKIKLTHDKAPDLDGEKVIAGYQLLPKEVQPKLQGIEQCFWMSGSSFDRALELYPEIINARHACGPGNTYKHLQEKLKNISEVKIYLSFEDWQKEYFDE